MDLRRIGYQSRLTCTFDAIKFGEMQLAKQIMVLTVSAVLAAYSFDCEGITTPEQAMQCCNSMHCSSQGHHGQDCCKTMPSMHAPFVKPASANGVSFASAVFAVLPRSGESLGIDKSARMIAVQSHSPPIFYDSAPTPLRI